MNLLVELMLEESWERIMVREEIRDVWLLGNRRKGELGRLFVGGEIMDGVIGEGRE